MGPQREISDIAGVNFVNINNDIAQREDLAYRLAGLGLAVDLQNVRRWSNAGNFDDALNFLAAPPPFDHGSGTEASEQPQIALSRATDLEQVRTALRSEIDSICRSATAQGWAIKNRNRSTLRLQGPRGQVCTFFIGEPRDSRVELRKFAAELRAAGLRVPRSVRDPHDDNLLEASTERKAAEPVNLVEALRCGIYCVASCVSVGGLIQAVPGSFGGSGGFRTNRSGWAA